MKYYSIMFYALWDDNSEKYPKDEFEFFIKTEKEIYSKEDFRDAFINLEKTRTVDKEIITQIIKEDLDYISDWCEITESKYNENFWRPM